jgi:hypothetical protein
MNFEVNENFKVYDNRNINSFKNYTFTGFNKSTLFSSFNNFLIQNNLPKSIYTGLELLFSNQIDIFISKIIKIYAVEININNPKLIIILNHRIKDLFKIISESSKNEIELRNNQLIRNIIVELICLINNSPKKSISIPKINNSHFNFENIKDKIIGTDKIIIKKIFKSEDPQELMLPINELINHIKISIVYHKQKHSLNMSHLNNVCNAEPLFWLSWLLEWDKKIKSKDSNLVIYCASRKSDLYDDKFSTEITWLIWNVINYFAQDSNDDTIFRLIKNNFQLFCHKYSKTSKNERKYLIYNCVMIIIYPNINYNFNIFNDRSEILRACLNTNLISKRIMIDGKKFFDSRKEELTNWNNNNTNGSVFKKVDISKINYDELRTIEKNLNNVSTNKNKNHKLSFNDINTKKEVPNNIKPVEINKNDSNNNILQLFNTVNKNYEKVQYKETPNKPKIDTGKINMPLLDGTNIKIEKDLFENKKNKNIIDEEIKDLPEKFIEIKPTDLGVGKKGKMFKSSLENKKTNNKVESGLDLGNLLSDVRKHKEIDENIYNNKPEIVEKKTFNIETNNIHYIFNKLFINQIDVNQKTKCLGKKENYIFDEKETSFSNSSHKIIFKYDKIYFPLLSKKYSSINKTFIPSIINDLKELFGIYKLDLTRFCLKDNNKKNYYLCYSRKYPDKFIKINDLENLISEDIELIQSILKIIAFRWVIGTNDSNYKTILLHHTFEDDDDDDLKFNLRKSNNKSESLNLISYEENSIGGDCKINFNNSFMKTLNKHKKYIEKIFENWEKNTNINEENIKNIFYKYLPKDIDLDIDLKIMFITYKLQNNQNIFNLF